MSWYNQGKGYVNNIKIKYATDISVVVLEAGSGVIAKAWHFSVKHHQTNNVGFWKGFFSVYKYKFFQLSKIWKITKPNINKYFEIPRVQIQIGGRNIKPWLITKYLLETKKLCLK